MRPYTPTDAMRHDDDDELDIDRGKCSHEYPPKIKIKFIVDKSCLLEC